MDRILASASHHCEDNESSELMRKLELRTVAAAVNGGDEPDGVRFPRGLERVRVVAILARRERLGPVRVRLWILWSTDHDRATLRRLFVARSTIT